ncbi:hypothetical protein [Ruminococcus sp. AM31-15AC]|uniref:hypothetical protein n=1 Tax=Ruminococcus sp. AM31-15AC TaxID=2293202 RepID=UPI0011C136CD
MALIDDEEDKNAFEMLYKNYRNLRPQILYNFFGASGGGIQYLFDKSIYWYIKNGYLERLP